MAGVEFRVFRQIAVCRIVCRLIFRVAEWFRQNIVNRGTGPKRATLVFNGQAHFKCFVGYGFHQQGLFDQLHKHAFKQNVIGRGQILLGQLRAQQYHVADCNFGAIHRCQHGFGGRCVLRKGGSGDESAA